MSKKFLFIIDNPKTLKFTKDTSIAFMQESQLRGIDVYACEIGDLHIKNGKCHALCAPININNQENIVSYCSSKQVMCIDDFAAAFMRKDPPVDEAFISALWVLRAYDPQKTLMINEPSSILLANEKIFGLDIAHDYFSETIVSNNKNTIKLFIQEHERVVFKPINQCSGKGILIFDKNNKNINSVIDILTQNKSFIIVQKYIENAHRGDKRILLLNGEILGCLLRKPNLEDQRANLNAGGFCEPVKLNKRDIDIVNHLKPYIQSFKLHFVGIDVIEGYITEINVTSPTMLRQMEYFEPENNLKAKVIDYVLKNLPLSKSIKNAHNTRS